VQIVFTGDDCTCSHRRRLQRRRQQRHQVEDPRHARGLAARLDLRHRGAHLAVALDRIVDADRQRRDHHRDAVPERHVLVRRADVHRTHRASSMRSGFKPALSR
jgi:hypothetical protein